MTVDEIESVLGADVVLQLQGALRNAYVTAHGQGSLQAQSALEELMIVLLAAIAEPFKDETRARQCVVLLRRALADVKSDLARPEH